MSLFCLLRHKKGPLAMTTSGFSSLFPVVQVDAQQQKTLPSPSPAAEDVAKSGFHRSECREVPEWSEIVD